MVLLGGGVLCLLGGVLRWCVSGYGVLCGRVWVVCGLTGVCFCEGCNVHLFVGDFFWKW